MVAFVVYVCRNLKSPYVLVYLCGSDDCLA